MLRNKLFKRFGKDGMQEPVDGLANAGLNPMQDYPTIDEIVSKLKPITQDMMGLGKPTSEKEYEKKYGKLEISPAQTSSIAPIAEREGMGNRMFADIRNQNQTLDEAEYFTTTPESIQEAQDLSNEVASQFDPQKQFKFPKLNKDLTEAIPLGLLGVDAALGYNQDINNQRKLNESIQQRNSKPLYDYNYMYGRTTSGGTEYQPTIKAEMGAKINKRYASEGMNDVEIEGGEYIQLPNLDTEMAEGPSHSNGGIPTNLPDQTRVYSNNLKPEGSKKTFAQIAKNYDITSYKKTLENTFSKQVDKDTASLMMQRNQKILDKLFADQQIMNGNSNGEVEAKNGASINNPGFKALPGYVQAKITANMADGAITKDPIPTYTSNTKSRVAKMDPKLNLLDAQVPGLQSTLPSGVFGEESNLDLFKKNYVDFIQDLEAQGETFDPKNKEQLYRAQVAYNEEVKSRALKAGYSLEEAENFASEMGFIPEEGSQRSTDSKLGLYTASRQLPNFTPKIPPTTPETPPGFNGVPPNPPTFNVPPGSNRGKYIRGEFPLYQAIPEAMGLAQAQEIYSYAIPEIDAPYLRPQTLNIQSELQDIDNMGTATMRAGANPLDVYIAGLDAKQKAFQTKQNFDVQSRANTDAANADAEFQADQVNARYFDNVYNDLIGSARDAQSGEKMSAISRLVNKKGRFEQEENLKNAYISNLVSNFDVDSTGKFILKPSGDFSYSTPPATAKKGMYKKLKK